MSFLVTLIVTFCTIAALVRLFVKRTWNHVTENVDLSGKTVIVTGANAGIGEALAIEFARRNARVILACRSIIRGEGARQYVQTEAERSDGGIVFKRLDLSSLESVRNFAEEIIETESRLDILVNNAGITGQPVKATNDGIDLTYQTNHFGPFLLTNLLLELLKKSGPGSRIINVTSASHSLADLNLDYVSPDDVKTYIAKEQKGKVKKKAELLLYQNSKLMNVMFSFELARRLVGSGVTVNCGEPGVVSTKLLQERRPIIMFMRIFLEVIAKSATEGCQTILHCAISRRLDDVTGRYFSNCEENQTVHEMALDRKQCEKLWCVSERMTSVK